MLARGKIGPQSYIVPPLTCKEKIGGRKISYWPPQAANSAQTSFAHSVLLVGALFSGHVLLMDISDSVPFMFKDLKESNPSLDDTRQVCIMSYENFTKRITDLSGQYRAEATVLSEAPMAIGYLAYRKA